MAKLSGKDLVHTVEVFIDGIPCLAYIETFKRHPGSFRRDAPSDLDFFGYTDLEYQIHDLKGYPAPWLERKLDRKETRKVEEQIFDKRETLY